MKANDEITAAAVCTGPNRLHPDDDVSLHFTRYYLFLTPQSQPIEYTFLSIFE